MVKNKYIFGFYEKITLNKFLVDKMQRNSPIVILYMVLLLYVQMY